MTKIVIHRVSCHVCGEIFCGTTQKEAKAKHKKHVDMNCTILRFWRRVNKILGKELTIKEVDKLFGIKRKYEKGRK